MEETTGMSCYSLMDWSCFVGLSDVGEYSASKQTNHILICDPHVGNLTEHIWKFLSHRWHLFSSGFGLNFDHPGVVQGLGGKRGIVVTLSLMLPNNTPVSAVLAMC